jgi:helix-turn-helix protein
MSVEAMSWALKQRTGSTAHKAVLLALADRAGFEWECWPSQATIAAETEMSERSVRRILADLEERGFIERAHRGNAQGGRSTDLITLTGQSGRKGLPDNHDRVTGQIEQGYRTPVSGEPSVEPSLEPEDPPTPPTAIELAQKDRMLVTDDFDAFWLRYPRRVGKQSALKAFTRALKKARLDEILYGLECWRPYWEARDQPEYIPHPSTWLNDERWNDSPPPIPGQQRQVPKGQQLITDIFAALKEQ